MPGIANFKLPTTPAMAERGLVVRPAKRSDQEFERVLFLSTRWDEMAATGWPDAAKAGFLTNQFELQTKHYRTYYRDGAFRVVMQAGAPIGRLILWREAAGLRLVDISLLAEKRGQRVGTVLLEAVAAFATTRGWAMSLSVAHFNPARRLYERLGFAATGQHGLHIEMMRPCP